MLNFLSIQIILPLTTFPHTITTKRGEEAGGRLIIILVRIVPIPEASSLQWMEMMPGQIDPASQYLRNMFLPHHFMNS